LGSWNEHSGLGFDAKAIIVNVAHDSDDLTRGLLKPWTKSLPNE
jgi:hypothetical protein